MKVIKKVNDMVGMENKNQAESGRFSHGNKLGGLHRQPYAQIGEILDGLMKAKGWTTRDLENVTRNDELPGYVSHQYISLVMRGTRNPGTAILDRLLKPFGYRSVREIRLEPLEVEKIDQTSEKPAKSEIVESVHLSVNNRIMGNYQGSNDFISTIKIDARGEQVVSSDLQQNFYQAKVNAVLPGTNYIDAVEESSNAKIVVLVKAAIAPSSPSELTKEELQNIKSRASNIGAGPYLAQVQLDNLLNPTGPVNYKKLNE